jgi:hypothetical protein
VLYPNAHLGRYPTLKQFANGRESCRQARVSARLLWHSDGRGVALPSSSASLIKAPCSGPTPPTTVIRLCREGTACVDVHQRRGGEAFDLCKRSALVLVVPMGCSGEDDPTFSVLNFDRIESDSADVGHRPNQPASRRFDHIFSQVQPQIVVTQQIDLSRDGRTIHLLSV